VKPAKRRGAVRIRNAILSLFRALADQGRSCILALLLSLLAVCIGLAQECSDYTQSLSWSPKTPKVGETITFELSIDPESPSPCDEYRLIIRNWPGAPGQLYEWIIDEDPTNSTSASGTFVYETAGEWDLIITTAVMCDCLPGGTQNYHHIMDSITVIADNAAPSAKFSFSPTNPKAGELVTFDASSSGDPDGDIEEYEWFFWDDMSKPKGVVVHTYSRILADQE